jgi:hypothetical protein
MMLEKVCMLSIYIGMESEHENQDQTWNYDLNALDALFNQPKAKVARKDKQQWQIVESFHLNTMARTH